MSTPTEFYLRQASDCATSALAATLPNLREKFLRAQLVWEQLAERETATRTARETREAEKAAQVILAGETQSLIRNSPSGEFREPHRPAPPPGHP